jgi:hypothetical protein
MGAEPSRPRNNIRVAAEDRKWKAPEAFDDARAGYEAPSEWRWLAPTGRRETCRDLSTRNGMLP